MKALPFDESANKKGVCPWRKVETPAGVDAFVFEPDPALDRTRVFTAAPLRPPLVHRVQVFQPGYCILVYPIYDKASAVPISGLCLKLRFFPSIPAFFKCTVN